MKTFEEYIKIVLPDWYDDFSEEGYKHTVDYINKMKSKLEQQAKDLEALRGFACYMVDMYPEFYEQYDKFNFLDENGNPTPLLTGEK